MSLDDWQEMLRRQRYKCGLGHEFPDGRTQIDHEHVRGWSKLDDAKRRSYVRGLLCPFCNHYVVGRHRDSSVLLAAGRYLKRYEDRKL